jgi:membrane protein implicated in regulation of membrane protease activity
MPVVIDQGKMMKPVRPFVAGILCAMALLMLLDLQLSGLSRALLELLVFMLLWYAFARWQSRRGICSHDRDAGR